MASVTETKPRHLLRPEAQPVFEWGLLTEHQQQGLKKIVDMLGVALDRLDAGLPTDQDLPWIKEEHFSQLVFLDGKRGTGKTTLMLTLGNLLDGSSSDGGFVEAVGILDAVKKLRDRVVLLEPLDMEPMPKGTPILSAILARLNLAANQLGMKSPSQRGLMDNDLQDDRDYIRFTQLQAKIARALDSNLKSRMGGLDREQFGQEVINQEDDRLKLPSLLSESLAWLSKALPNKLADPSSKSEKQQRLFLVPIDDVDMNPERCLELLRLLRHYSVPQIFFLLMGQLDLVESIVKLKISDEYRHVGDSTSSLSAVSPIELRRKLAEVAVANLQKLIPNVVELPAIGLDGVLKFRPLLRKMEDDDPSKLPTLGDLFSEIAVSEPGVTVSRGVPISNLRQLLECRGPKTAGDFLRGQYPGLGAFEVTSRRLVDLWRQLSEALQTDTFDARSSNERLLEVFNKHWKRIVDEDPWIDDKTRETLQREGTDACEVMTDDDDEPFTEYVIDGAPSPEDSDGQLAGYRPVLRITLSNAGSGVPRIRLRGEQGQEIEHPRTRCAYVLMHDLQRFLSADVLDQPLKRPMTGRSPISVSWAADSRGVGWRQPSLPTFARQVEFFKALNLEDPADATSESGPRSLTKEELQKLLFKWITYGTELLAGEPTSEVTGVNWGQLVLKLKNIADSASLEPAPFRKWTSDVVLLSMPEACGIELTTSSAEDLSKLPKLVRAAIDHFRPMLARNRRELQARRQNQLRGLWDSHPDLWKYVNELSHDNSWIFLQAKQPKEVTPDQISDQIQTLRGDVDQLGGVVNQLGGVVGRLESRMKRESQLSQFTSLARQAASALKTSRETAKVFLEEVAEVAPKLVEAVGDDDAFASTVRREFEQAAEKFEDAGVRLAAIGLREQAVELARSIAEKDGASDAARSTLGYSYDHLGHGYLQVGRRDAAEKAIQSAFEIEKQFFAKYPDNAVIQCDLSSLFLKLGDVYLQAGRRDDAEKAIQSGFEIVNRLVEKDPDNKLAQRILRVTYNRLGEVYLHAGRDDDANKAFQSAFDAAKRLAKKDSDDADAQRALGVAYNRLGNIHMQAGRRNDAEKAFKSAFSIVKPLVEKDPDNARAQRDLSLTYNLLGEVYVQAKRRGAAEEAFRSALAIAQRLRERDPDYSEFQLDLAVCQWKLSKVARGGEKTRLQDEAAEILMRERERDAYFFPRAVEAEKALNPKKPIKTTKPMGKRKKAVKKKAVKKKAVKK